MESWWHDKLVNFLTCQGAHEDELEVISLLKGDEFLSWFGFHVAAGLVSQDNKSNWNNQGVRWYICEICRHDNMNGVRLALTRAWPTIAAFFPDAAENSKFCLRFCEAKYVPGMAKFIEATPRHILDSFSGRTDIQSFDRRFVEETISRSISQWYTQMGQDQQEDKFFAESIVCEGRRCLTRHELVSILEQGAYELDSKTRPVPGVALNELNSKTRSGPGFEPGIALNELFKCTSSLGNLMGDSVGLAGANCLFLYGIDYRDMHSGGHTWSSFESENQLQARRRISMSKDSLGEVLSVRPVVDLALGYLFTKTNE